MRILVTDDEPSGATFAQALKERRETWGIPLIVLTGLATEDMPSSVREDADLFLRKPVAPQALLRNVRRLLESPHALRARSVVPPQAARCPQCCESLTWLERGRIDARQFDYYHWCSRGCGLYCFDIAARTWIRLV